jgi:hypothetical protein
VLVFDELQNKAQSSKQLQFKKSSLSHDSAQNCAGNHDSQP